MSSNEQSLNPNDNPAAPAVVVDDPAESVWLKEAKTALRARDPGEAAEEASSLSSWAHLRWMNIRDDEEAALRNYYHLGYFPDD